MLIRETTEQIERQTLSLRASFSDSSKGRAVFEPECELRTAYQRDRDRILHSKSFRRLKHKTQVFLAPKGDHYRTRLTHTLEVSQIGRTIARALRLNEDLTEAVALGHDLGHTPFGHAGERALDEVYSKGFKHFLQSVRIVDKLEKDGRGLNLTYEVKNGIACHTRGMEADTLEGRIVRLADKVAYINHDIDDAVRAGVLSFNDIPEEITAVLGDTRSMRIDAMVRSIVSNSVDTICMDSVTEKAFLGLHEFMFENVYYNPVAKSEESKSMNLLKDLFSYFCANPDKLPGDFDSIREEESDERAVCDYIAGMSDEFALFTFEDIFIPKSWNM